MRQPGVVVVVGLGRKSPSQRGGIGFRVRGVFEPAFRVFALSSRAAA